VNASATIAGIAFLAIGLVMLRFRDRIEAFWASVFPVMRSQSRWLRNYNYVGGPAVLIIFGVVLLISGVTGHAH
jgi:hypothetical protein